MTIKVKVKGKPALKKLPNILESRDRPSGDDIADAKELPLWCQFFDLGKTDGEMKIGGLKFKSTESGLQFSPDDSRSPLLEYKGSKLKNWLKAGGTTLEVMDNLKYTFDRYNLDLSDVQISDITVETKKLHASLKDKKGEAGMQANFKLQTKAGPLELKFDTGKEYGVSFGRFNLYLSNENKSPGSTTDRSQMRGGMLEGQLFLSSKHGAKLLSCLS